MLKDKDKFLVYHSETNMEIKNADRLWDTWGIMRWNKTLIVDVSDSKKE